MKTNHKEISKVGTISVKYFFFSVALFLSFLILSPFYSFSQKKRIELEKEKLENQKKIAETNRILEETKTKKTVTIGQLTVITQQIKQKNNQINTFEKEIMLIESDILKIESSINYLVNHLNDLKKEYSIMIYNASKANDSYSKLIFLFSAKTFNQLVMRIKYFKYYSQARQKHIIQIKKVAVTLRKNRHALYEKRRQRSGVIKTIKTENVNLGNLKNEQESTVTQLSQKETELNNELEERSKALKKLEKIITDLIKKEMERAAAAAAAAAASSSNASSKKAKKTVLEADYLSTSFSGNKSKLFWPVQHGFISQRFGKRPHAVLRNVMVENLGVDIQTNKNEKVRSVFDGTITAVAEVPGMNNIIMIQHGEYYTFYAKLKSTFVKVGQKVKAKEFIGEVYTDSDEVTEVQFQIWKNSEKQDPESWLYTR